MFSKLMRRFAFGDNAWKLIVRRVNVPDGRGVERLPAAKSILPRELSYVFCRVNGSEVPGVMLVTLSAEESKFRYTEAPSIC